MIAEGEQAPGFTLPALVDGAHRRVSLDECVGEDVLVLAFYPADFNPACGAESDLDELDLFTMQKDVSVLGIGPDSLYSHAAFADEYNLHIPLLADTRREVAEAYGVAREDELGQALVERAVFVVDPDGVVQFAWSSADPERLPPVDAIKDAIADTGGDDTAFARYRVGHAHYTEGRRAFTSAMAAFRDSEWMLAQSDFQRAREAFEAAADHFDSAVRFVDDPEDEHHYDRAQEKATALWQAADWLTQSASAYSSGSGGEGRELRDDAERPLEEARSIGEPVDPDDWPPDPDEDDGILPQEDDGSAELAVDIDDAVAGEADGPLAEDTAAASAEDSAAVGRDGVDEAELEEIEAELAAADPDDPETDPGEEATSMVDAPPADEDGAEIGDDDIAEVQAELAEQSADIAARADEGRDGGAAGGEDEGRERGDGDAPTDGDGGGSGDGAAPPTGEDPGDDLSTGTDAALEPERGADADGGDASDGGDDEDGEEPQGASDADLDAIPTTEELAAESEEGDDEEGRY